MSALDDPEDGPPCIPPPPGPGAEETIVPEPARMPTEPPAPLTAEQGAVMVQMLQELVTAVGRLPAMFAEEREHQAKELQAATKLLRGDIEGTRLEVVELGNKLTAALDRAVDKRMTDVEGKVEALATEQHGLRHALGEHVRVSTEIRDRAYELAKKNGGGGEYDADEQPTAAEFRR